MLDLSDGTILTNIITIFCMFKRLRRDMEDISKLQIKFLRTKTLSTGRINGRLDIAEYKYIWK